MSAVLWLNFIFLGMFILCPPHSFAADKAAQEAVKKTSTQQIGGLLFDVDEGTKIEQGPGGSVYVKSNKEYMQDKFLQIEGRLSQLESRVAGLEKANEPAQPSPVPAKDENHKVLVS